MKTVLITGCSGYVGALLTKKIASRDDVALVVGLDKMPLPQSLHAVENLHFIQSNTSGAWEEEAARYNPDYVVHCAWQIRELFGEQDTQRMWNINGSHQVFDFVFNQGTVQKFVHISTVASYGAYPGNSRTQVFTENDPLRSSDYSYAEEKREVEEMLFDLYEKYANHKTHLPEVFVLRPVSITGPVGRSRTAFSLQSALRGKARDNIFTKVLSRALSFTPISASWTRQFVHEDDVVGAIEHALFEAPIEAEIDVCNICPSGKIVTGEEMASYLKKRPIVLPASLYKILFALAWNLTRGKVATPKGSYKTYVYPIVVDGSKLQKKYGYKYKYTVQEALEK
jgi:nucleoside-diphosphate-sugar epimerase